MWRFEKWRKGQEAWWDGGQPSYPPMIQRDKSWNIIKIVNMCQFEQCLFTRRKAGDFNGGNWKYWIESLKIGLCRVPQQEVGWTVESNTNKNFVMNRSHFCEWWRWSSQYNEYGPHNISKLWPIRNPNQTLILSNTIFIQTPFQFSYFTFQSFTHITTLPIYVYICVCVSDFHR